MTRQVEPTETQYSSHPRLQRFYLERIKDETEISGTGVVNRGVVLPSSMAVLEWVTRLIFDRDIRLDQDARRYPLLWRLDTVTTSTSPGLS